MKAQAFYWLHLLPLLLAMGLALILMLASVALSLSARRRGTWLPRFFTGLFGALLFVSPPFRALSHPLPVGQMSWTRLNDSAAVLLRDHAYVDGYTSAWVPDFLVGFLAFIVARMLFDRLRR
jgi:hypothetical protein